MDKWKNLFKVGPTRAGRIPLWLPIIALILIFVVFIISSDITKIHDSIMKMQFSYLLIAITLWVSGSLIRTVRWHFFLNEFDNRIPFKKNFKYYLAGFAFVISPGRIGEIVRSPYIKRDYGVSISKTASIVFVQRIYDLIGLTIVLSIGLIFIDYTQTILLVPLSMLFLIFLILKNKNKLLKLMNLVSKIKLFRNLDSNVEEIYDSIAKLLKAKFFILGCSISTISFIFYSTAVYFLITGLDAYLSFQEIMVISTISQLLSFISLIPAGIGVFEGGMIGLFTLYGIDYETAITATILIRLITTGVVTVIGLYFLRIISKPKSIE